MTELAPLDHVGRLERVSALLEDLGCDGLLVTSRDNIRYLTGFSGSAGLVLVTRDDVHFVTDGRYGEQAQEQLARAGIAANLIVAGADQRERVQAVAHELPTLALEARAVSWADQRSYATDWFPDSVLVPTEGLIENLRASKQDAEIARITAAAVVADAALAACLDLLTKEPTELEFAFELDTCARRLGSDGPAFDTIIASGPNSARPHARPSSRRIRRGDLVVIDFGATCDGYRSDMTRTVSIGPPSREQRRLLDVVAAAKAAATAQVHVGAAVADIDAAARAVIAEAGWGAQFPHGTGHGLGLEIHETPILNRGSKLHLLPGGVITIEPGVYLEGVGGVRLEDTVRVTDEGCETITSSPLVLELAG